MAGIQELKAELKKNAALLEQVKGAKSIEEVIEIVKKVGFSISAADVEEMTNVSAEDLAKSAGGINFIVVNKTVIAND